MYMLTALILGIWLLLRMDKEKQDFLEASLFTFLSMIIVYAMSSFTLPTVNAIWLMSWFVLWLFVLASFWLLDVVTLSTVSGAIFSLLAGVGYFFLQQHVTEWVTSFLDGNRIF